MAARRWQSRTIWEKKFPIRKLLLKLMLLSNKVFVISIANCSRLMFRTEQTCSNVRRALILVAVNEHNHPLMLEIIAPDRLARGLPS